VFADYLTQPASPPCAPFAHASRLANGEHNVSGRTSWLSATLSEKMWLTRSPGGSAP
jgi:hypothetical protein